MSVTSVALHSQGTSGNVSGSDREAIKASYRSMYRVRCSSAADTIDEVIKHFRTTPSLPYIGRRFKFGNGFNTSVFCKDLQADYVDKSDGQFIVSAKFESLEGNKNNDGGGTTIDGRSTDNPLLRHHEISVTYQTISVPVEEATLYGFAPLGINNRFLRKGYKGAVVASNMQPYDPTLEDEARIQVVRITQNIPAYNGDQYAPYQDAINSDRFTISKPQYKFRISVGLYKAKFGSITSDFNVESGIPYFRQTAEVLITSLPYGWLRLVVDRGRNRRMVDGDKNDAGVTLSPGDDQTTRLTERKIFTSAIKDDYGYPVSDPVRLDGNGQPLKQDGKTVHMIWQTKELKPFAGLRW